MVQWLEGLETWFNWVMIVLKHVIYTIHLVVKHSNKFCNEVLFVFTSAIFWPSFQFKETIRRSAEWEEKRSSSTTTTRVLPRRHDCTCNCHVFAQRFWLNRAVLVMILQPVPYIRSQGVEYTPQEEALPPAPPFNMEDHGTYGPERGDDDKKLGSAKRLQRHTRSFAQRLHNEKKTMLPAWVGGAWLKSQHLNMYMFGTVCKTNETAVPSSSYVFLSPAQTQFQL